VPVPRSHWAAVPSSLAVIAQLLSLVIATACIRRWWPVKDRYRAPLAKSQSRSHHTGGDHPGVVAGDRYCPGRVLVVGEGVQYCAGRQVPHDRRPVVADGDRPGAAAGDGRRDWRVGGAASASGTSGNSQSGIRLRLWIGFPYPLNLRAGQHGAPDLCSPPHDRDHLSCDETRR